MLLTALVLILNLVVLCIAVGAWLTVRRIRREIETAKAAFSDFITPAAPDSPSQLAKAIDAVSQMFARSIAASVKGTLMGMQSGAVRGETAIQGALLQDTAAQAGLGALLSSFPAVSRTLKKNPALFDMAMGFLANRANKAAAPAGSNGERPKFSL